MNTFREGNSERMWWFMWASWIVLFTSIQFIYLKKNLASLYRLAGIRKCYSLKGEGIKNLLCVCVVFSPVVVLLSAHLWNWNRLEFQIFLFGRASLEDNAIPF